MDSTVTIPEVLVQQPVVHETPQDSETRYRELVELSPDAVFILCDGVCVFVNAAGIDLLGAADKEDLLGLALLEMIHSDKPEVLQEQIQTILQGGKVPRREERFVRFDGSLVHVEIAASPFTYQGRPAVQIVAHDISARKQADEQLHYLAYYDTLTSLPNRALFHELLTQAIADANSEQDGLTVMMLDIDLFGEVNTVFGHGFGDQLLQAVAARLGEHIDREDILARAVGDAFSILFRRVGSAQDAQAMAQRLLASLNELFCIDGHELHITASVGVARYPSDGDTAEALEQSADLALYRAKSSGNPCTFFVREMSDAITRKRVVEKHLRHAIENNELQVYFQPQVQLNSMEVVAMEALSRWMHPEWGMVLPGQYIPVAEDTGLIEALDEWTLRSACLQVRKWQLAGHHGLRVASNLSARQFRRHNLVETIADVLEETQLPPNTLELEITETTAMENVDRTLAILLKLYDLGVRLAIDDFGTGYSSLGYLKRFPVHTLKIDRMFVQDLTRSDDYAAIVRAIIGLTHTLSLSVLAEGVDSVDQLQFLRDHGCDEVQGYLFSKPLPPNQFWERFLADKQPIVVA